MGIELPAETAIDVALIRPIWQKTAKPGDAVYAQTIFPVSVGNTIAVPSGTCVEGKLVALTLPTRKSGKATLEISLSKIIFADGYIVIPGRADSPTAPISEVVIQVTPANDLLLDNGAQFQLTLGARLDLDSARVNEAVPLSNAPKPGAFKSATLCRPTAGYPGSPGTPDTVIPGTPGTPSITIPGGPGMPDTTIPGTPATPPTVIPGSPGTPGSAGSACPAPPLVLSSRLLPPGSGNASGATTP